MQIIAVLMVICGSSYSAKADTRSGDLFPVYPSIKNAVEFWKKIYTQYSTKQGVIHDDRHLDIIYEIVELQDSNNGGSGKHNQQKIKAVKNKYKEILGALASGKSPASEDEKRVASLFGEQATQKTFHKAKDSIRFQLGQKDRFRQGVIRSGMYLAEIKRIFRSHGLPEELAFLPHVESSFDYQAYSKFGAAGIWQFTHGTGKKYMTIDYSQDNRRDPIYASHAAAKFLKYNYETLGNWPMAITAYNHGLNGMARAQKSSKDDFEAILREYNGRSFGFASRNFYAEFLAALEIASNQEKYFGNMQLATPVKTVEVEMPAYISVKDVADYFKTDVKTLEQLNLALRKPVFMGQKHIPKGYRLRLPEKADQNLKDLASRMPEKMFSSKQLHSRFYRVQKGDTPGAIARAEGVKLAELLMANGLGPRSRIFPNQNLRIPAPNETILLAASSVPSSQKRSETILLNKKAEKPVPVSPPPPKPKKEDIIKPVAETIAPPEPTLANDESVAQASIKENGVPVVEVNIDVVTGDFQIEKVINAGAKTVGIINVETEETLGHYADWLGIPTQSIRRLNGFRFGRPIRTNQKIKIPLLKTTKEEFEEKRYEYHKEMEEDFFSVYRVDGVTLFTVKSGDNIWTLCQKTFDLPFWLIRKYNEGQNLEALKPGQQLKLPTVLKIIEE